MEFSNFNKLFVLEMANNHMGDVDHGVKLIREFAKVVKKYPFQFAIKFQYRDLDTFIHPDFKDRMDIKYIKRFSETRLSEEQFLTLKKEAEAQGFITMCTPFDEISVDRIENHGYQIVKIGSCSFTDWPLLERIAETDKPIIASTAGASLNEINRVVSFFEHRDKQLCIMHCVGAYPTPDSELELNQIDFFKEHYPELTVGFSTHEDPTNMTAILMSIAKGAQVFERHVGLKTEKYGINGYSSTPEQIDAWLTAAQKAYATCGVKGERRMISKKEYNDLRGLRRGVFAKRPLTEGEEINKENSFLAIPNSPDQLLANDTSKYSRFKLKNMIVENRCVLVNEIDTTNTRAKVLEVVNRLCGIISESGLRIGNRLDLELSHHYGIDHVDHYGCAILNCINREYCKKIIILLPGQENPTHYHKKKEETFHVLHGELSLIVNGLEKVYEAGDMVTVERGEKHSFSSKDGAIFEEVSTTHFKNDSYYEDQSIMDRTDRKTQLTFWADWLKKVII